MAKWMYLIIFSFTCYVSSYAQFGSILDKAKDKAQEKIEKKIDDAIDKSDDKNKNKQDKNQNNSDETNQTNTGTGTSVNTRTYQNYDFVPGDKIIFEDNFADDESGEFPSHWDLLKGQAQINNFQGENIYLCLSL